MSDIQGIPDEENNLIWNIAEFSNILQIGGGTDPAYGRYVLVRTSYNGYLQEFKIFCSMKGKYRTPSGMGGGWLTIPNVSHRLLRRPYYVFSLAGFEPLEGFELIGEPPES